jgi:hypothetical protein
VFWCPINSVADTGCLSWIPDPDFYPSRIRDPRAAPKEEGKKSFLSYHFFSHKYHKIVNNFSFEQVKKFSLGKSLIILFTQKFVTKLSKKYGFGIRDPRSGIRKNPVEKLFFKNAKLPRISLFIYLCGSC